MTEGQNPRWHEANWPRPDWLENLGTATELLVEVARRGDLTYYSWITQRLPHEMDPHSHAFAALLGEMSADEHANDRPLLSCLCIYKGGNDPGSGFWAISHELGLISAPKTMSEVEKERFWSESVRQCHDYWRRR